LKNFPWASSPPWNVGIISAMTVSLSLSIAYNITFMIVFKALWFISVAVLGFHTLHAQFNCRARHHKSSSLVQIYWSTILNSIIGNQGCYIIRCELAKKVSSSQKMQLFHFVEGFPMSSLRYCCL
jgi:hypothetical protein